MSETEVSCGLDDKDHKEQDKAASLEEDSL